MKKDLDSISCQKKKKITVVNYFVLVIIRSLVHLWTTTGLASKYGETSGVLQTLGTAGFNFKSDK